MSSSAPPETPPVASAGRALSKAPRFVLALGLACALVSCGTDGWSRAFDASERGWLMNTWAPSVDERYAVGGSFEVGRVSLYDGQSWGEQDLPEGTPLLNWIYGFGAGEAFAVGLDGTIVRLSGGTWTSMESPTTQDLWGVWGAAPDDVWAVGGTARRPSEAEPTVLHYDGAAWTVVALPELMREGVDALFKIWGSGPDDVYAVGDRGIVLHWTGAAFEELFVGATDDLVAIWGTGPDHIVAVGGRSNGIVSFWNGTEWRSESLSPLPALNGVWMGRRGVAHLAGIRGTLVTFDTETFEVTESRIDEPLDFHAIHAVDGVVVAVGGNLAVPSSPEGMAWERNLTAEE